MFKVLEIYRITLLSNPADVTKHIATSFGDLQNYTTLKRDELPEWLKVGFGDLQNYTTLKRYATTAGIT